MTKLFFTSAVLAASLAAAPVAAEPQQSAGWEPEAREKTIAYQDLDLSKPAGADALISRLTRAAKSVCALPYPAAIPQYDVQKACIRKALDTAVAKVGEPLVTARHQAAGHRSVLARN